MIRQDRPIAPELTPDGEHLLPAAHMVQLLEEEGTYTPAPDHPIDLDAAGFVRVYRWLVIARRFDEEAIALARQGRLAVHPPSRGHEACHVGSTMALAPQDWLFPTYRDTPALLVRGVDPVAALTLMRGTWHSGYDPSEHRVAPQCTPMATHACHATGLAWAAARKGDPVVALVLMGDGATSEGDAHEAWNFAAVFNAPCIFLVQNNQYAISVPVSRQTRAPSFAHKAIGYGMPGVRVDGNDVLAVYASVQEAAARARGGGGPSLIEAVTYRLLGHSTSDDPSRYRDDDEVAEWARRDPIVRFERFLAGTGVLDDETKQATVDEAEALARDLHDRLWQEPELDPLDLFRYVYEEPTAELVEQRRMLEGELAAEDGP